MFRNNNVKIRIDKSNRAEKEDKPPRYTRSAPVNTKWSSFPTKKSHQTSVAKILPLSTLTWLETGKTNKDNYKGEEIDMSINQVEIDMPEESISGVLGPMIGLDK